MMQINPDLRFDLHQSIPLGRVVVFQNRPTRLVRVIVLPGKNRPPKHAPNDHHKEQRQRQQHVEDFHGGPAIPAPSPLIRPLESRLTALDKDARHLLSRLSMRRTSLARQATVLQDLPWPEAS